MLSGCTVEIIDILKQLPDGSYINERIYRDRSTGDIIPSGATLLDTATIFTGSTRDFETYVMVDDVNNDGSVLSYFTRLLDIEGTIIADYTVGGMPYTTSGTTHFAEAIFDVATTTYIEDTGEGCVAAGSYAVSFSYEPDGKSPPTTYVEGTRVKPGKSLSFDHPPNGRLPEICYTGATDFFITVVR